MSMITLVTGGCRSGKSSYALSRALEYPPTRLFFATAAPCDDEMKSRIQNHRKERGEAFITIEEEIDISGRLRYVDSDVTVVVIDCLTVWLGNLYYRLDNDESAIRGAVLSVADHLTTMMVPVFIVTNEVGSSIIPDNQLGRRYRDMAGFMNTTIASLASSVIMTVCGIPVTVK